jgi:uncharacterized BrkB/YihY/UPF0761 family membrane protein
VDPSALLDSIGVGDLALSTLLSLLVSLLCGWLCYRLARRKGRRPRAWMLWGLMLGPPPLLVLLFVPKRRVAA